MMGQQSRTESLFYYFRLEEQIPEDHLLRVIDRYVDFSFVRERLKSFYRATGRPSIDPEVLLRLLVVGYLHGITSERRLMEEVRMHLAYRWFTRLGFHQEIPDHSTFSKNRHGRFRQSGVFREVFEEIVRRCLEAGLVEGRNLAVDGTLVGANASQQSRVPREQLAEAAQVSRTVSQYLAELEQQNPVADSEEPSPSGPVSTTDPDAAWTAAKNGPALLAYYNNYLIGAPSRVILAVEATPARFRQETVAARRMLERVEKLGLRPECLGADKAYGSESFWLGCWRGISNPTFLSSTVAIRRESTSPETSFVMHLPRTSTTARKENRCAIGVAAVTVKVTLTARRRHSAGLSPEATLYFCALSLAVCTRGGTRPSDRPVAGRDAGLCLLPAPPAQDRSFFLCAQAAPGSTARAIAAAMECRRAVPIGGYRPESETAGAVPRSSAVFTCPEHCLRSKRERKKGWRAKGKLRSPARTSNRPESAFLTIFFNTIDRVPIHL